MLQQVLTLTRQTGEGSQPSHWPRYCRSFCHSHWFFSHLSYLPRYFLGFLYFIRQDSGTQELFQPPSTPFFKSKVPSQHHMRYTLCQKHLVITKLCRDLQPQHVRNFFPKYLQSSEIGRSYFDSSYTLFFPITHPLPSPIMNRSFYIWRPQ
jgi:hypothetical protein